jgi:hypothetical protein
MPALCSIPSPSWAGPASARASARVVPVRRDGANPPSKASTATATTSAAQRARTTPRAHAVQARLPVASLRSRRLGQSSRCPTPASSTGGSVTVTSALSSGISIPA